MRLLLGVCAVVAALALAACASNGEADERARAQAFVSVLDDLCPECGVRIVARVADQLWKIAISDPSSPPGTPGCALIDLKYARLDDLDAALVPIGCEP